MSTICLDYDRVLHAIDDPLPGRKMGPPVTGALAGVEALQQDGHKLIICTARNLGSLKKNHVTDWLDYYEFPKIPVVKEKPVADAYCDDLGYRFCGWANCVSDLDLLLRGRR